MAFDWWEFDDVHNGLIAWIHAWRDGPGAGVAGLPPYTFAEHLGREVGEMRDLGRLELARICSAAGYDGRCPRCGITPDEAVTERAAQIVEERGLTLSRAKG